MAAVSCFGATGELAEALSLFDDEFFGVEVDVAASAEAGGSLADGQLISSSDEDDDDMNTDSDAPVEEVDVEQAAADFLIDEGMASPAAATAATVTPAGPIQQKTCGCSKRCLENFDPAQLEQALLNFQEMEKNEQDLVVLGLLESSRYSVDTTTRGLKRKKQWFKYTYGGVEVCAGAFRSVYGIGTKVFENLKKHLETCGPVPRTHGNKGRKPKNALTDEAVVNVAQFIKNYADQAGIPYPAPPPLHSKKGVPPIFLPAGKTVTSIYKRYVESTSEAGTGAVGYHSFRSIWLKCLPHIRILTPCTDVCDLCEVLRRKVVEAVTEADKLQACQSLANHIGEAQAERDLYKRRTEEAKEELGAHPPVQQLQSHELCGSNLEKSHYTFDFAQNVALPQVARQIGPIYFKVPRKVHIFGINNEALPHQLNYLLDEADTIGMDGKNSHGPNSVASMLHHYFSRHGLKKRECYLHADNCSG